MKNDETAVHRTVRKDMILLLLAVTLVFAMTISSYADQPGEETAETAAEAFEGEQGEISETRYLNTSTSGNPGYANYTSTHYLTVAGTIKGQIVADYTGTGNVPDFTARLWGNAYNNYGTVCGSYDDNTQVFGSGAIDFTTAAGTITGTVTHAFGSIRAWINGVNQGVSTLYLP